MKKDEKGFREPGVIKDTFYGKEDHGITTVCVTIDLDAGSTQGFGNLCLDKKLAEDYIEHLCAAFGVSKLRDLKGKHCYALRCFTGWNSDIEGIEAPSGKRFIHTTWRRKHYPNIMTPLEEKCQELESNIMYATRTIKDCHERLKTLARDYKEWK
jgi:hypothetical protein